jgi:hypothetical protein
MRETSKETVPNMSQQAATGSSNVTSSGATTTVNTTGLGSTSIGANQSISSYKKARNSRLASSGVSPKAKADALPTVEFDYEPNSFPPLQQQSTGTELSDSLPNTTITTLTTTTVNTSASKIEATSAATVSSHSANAISPTTATVTPATTTTATISSNNNNESASSHSSTPNPTQVSSNSNSSSTQPEQESSSKTTVQPPAQTLENHNQQQACELSEDVYGGGRNTDANASSMSVYNRKSFADIVKKQNQQKLMAASDQTIGANDSAAAATTGKLIEENSKCEKTD